MGYQSRLGGAAGLPNPAICDAAMIDGRRFCGDFAELDAGQVMLGSWPDELDTDAVAGLASALGPGMEWKSLTATPAVVQGLGERARLQPFEYELLRYVQHLQHVCHRPRLHLRVEEERVPVSRARRTPTRAVATLVSHPGDWEHRTLRSIQPSRVLARTAEDEWNLYENRVAVRLVDHLLKYVGKRLEELLKIESALAAGRDHGNQKRSSHWRAGRIFRLWAETLTSKTDEELRATIRQLAATQGHLQALLGSPLYGEIPRNAAVPLILKPTNILVNDSHYRKVDLLWRAWVRSGHKQQETAAQRTARRQEESRAWDTFVLLLLVRALHGLGWSAHGNATACKPCRKGWPELAIQQDATGVVTVRSNRRVIRFLPVCTSFDAVEATAVASTIGQWDSKHGEVVVVHLDGNPNRNVAAPDSQSSNRESTAPGDVDRATGWTFKRGAVLLGCSPWSIDSEERMSRLMGGWLNRRAAAAFPARQALPALPKVPGDWAWMRAAGPYILALRAPSAMEVNAAQSWAAAQRRDLDNFALRARQAHQAFDGASREAAAAFPRFVEAAARDLAVLAECPVCQKVGAVEPRPGARSDGADATWWAICPSCKSGWGLRPCTSCGLRSRVLIANIDLDADVIANSKSASSWPDNVYGRDVWAQPCGSQVDSGHYRCSNCGVCPGGSCDRCQSSRARATVSPGSGLDERKRGKKPA